MAGALVSLVAPSPAWAAEPPGNPAQDVSAIDQYVEAIPTSSGPAPTQRSEAPRSQLPPEVAAKLRGQGGSDAEALTELATSPTYGAPGARTLTTPARRNGDGARERLDPQPSPLDAVVTPIAQADEPRLLLLVAILGTMTLFAFAASRARRT